MAIAEGLGTGDATTNETEILGIPTEILAFDFRVIDGNVLGLPEGVFRIEDGVVDFDVFGILEGVVALQLEIDDL